MIPAPINVFKMKLPIKLISTDFDGTIFAEFENPPIAPAFQKLIADLQSKGAKWVINTGRDLSSLMETLARTGITIEPDFLVVVEREIYVHDGIRYVGLEEWNTACSRAQQEVFTQLRADLPRLTEWVKARFHAQIYEDTYSPFCLIAGNNGDADVIHNYLDDYARSVPNLTVVRNDIYARFSHAAFNKGSALAEITRRLGLSAAEVFTAGDHLNDLPMLSQTYARWLAGPSNAIDSVKAVIRQQKGYVSHLSHGHGVAEALTKALRDGFDSI